MMRMIWIAALVLFTFGPTQADVTNPEPLGSFPQSVVAIATPDARLHQFAVWIADTEPRREQGLMFVKHMDENTGMLFIYPSPRRIAMWMKNTYIGLDMVFIRADGRVAHIVKGAMPLSLNIIDSSTEVLGVLELNAGTAARLGIAPGAIVTYPAFQK